MQPIREIMASQFPQQSQSPFTVGDISTVEAGGILEFHCTLFWNMRPVASVNSSSGPFKPLNWSWDDESAKDDFAAFLRLIRFPTADLFVGSMIACFSNIQWFARECEKDTLFRYPDDPPHIVQRVEKPFTPELKQRLKARYGKDIQFINEALDRFKDAHHLLD